MHQGSKILVQALMQPSRQTRLVVLEQLAPNHAKSGLELVSEMLRSATVLQRPALRDIVIRLLELRAEPELHEIFRRAQRDPDFPRRHIAWLATILDLHLKQSEIDEFLLVDDSDAVLPLVFHLWQDGRWAEDLNALLKKNPRERVQLWGQYLAKVLRNSERSHGPFPLLELNNLDDPFVGDWIEENLKNGYYDADILAVCIEREDSRYFDSLWRAVWIAPKHKNLTLRALTVTAPHVPTPTPILLERIIAKELPRQERQKIAHKIARSFSKLAFLRAQELCSSPVAERRIIGIEILEFFGSPWHNSRDACVSCLLAMLNDPQASVRARAVEALASSERARLAKLNPTALLDDEQPSNIDSAWSVLVDAFYQTPDYKPLREELWGDIKVESKTENKAIYRPQDISGTSNVKPVKIQSQNKTSIHPTETGSIEYTNTSTKYAPRTLFSSRTAYATIAPCILLIGLFMYGVMPRDGKGVATVMSTPILKGSTAVLGARQFFDDVDLKDDKLARSKAELEGAMQIPHAAIMLKRSKCWYLYHRLRPMDSAQYIATAPVPASETDPTWEIYDTWLLDFIGTEMANGVFDRVGEFVMTIAMVNPPLANQLVPKILNRAGLLVKDSVAESLVKGGAIDLERPVVHPALSELDEAVISELRDALLWGWKTNEERVLAKYLADL